MQLPFLSQYSGKRICVALSGGRDSVALAHYLKSNADAYGFSVCAVTCEHGIRGEQSLRDLAFVEELCRSWNIPLSVFRADIPAIAKQSGRGVEEEGREFRYVCFEQVVEEGFADLVVTAHHRDDIAETVLFRLARGTSASGLNTLCEWECVSRPFREVTRKQIDEYILRHQLPFVEDESNADCAYARNLIRTRVMPLLEEISSSAAEHLAAFADRISEDDDYLQSLAQEQLKRSEGEVFIPIHLPSPLFTRACVLAIKAMGIVRDYTSAHVEELRSLAQLQSGKRVCLPQGVVAYREGERLVFCRERALNTEELAFCEGEYDWDRQTLLITQEEQDDGLYADANAFPDGCVIRTRREGDVFQPFGGRRKKLKAYLTDRKIPARVGKTLPLVAKDGEVYAIFGVEISEKVKVTENTSHKLYLCIN